jgi:hypothetical protein
MKEQYEAPSLEIIKFAEDEEVSATMSQMDGNDIQALWLRGEI